MDFAFGEKEEEFRQEVRDFLSEVVTPEMVEERAGGKYYERGPHSKELMRKVGEKGWLALTWPKEYGGQGRPLGDRFIFAAEMLNYGVAAGGSGIAIVAPILMRHGTEEQKKEWLPKIARGEIEFSLGYTEPDAGTDLASLQTRAVRDGDDYIINGQKVYSTMAHQVGYHWLAARTNVDEPKKHKGISLFMVDLKSPGITIRPLKTIADELTTEVFYDNVRVPAKNRVGEENQGWYYIAEALDFERSLVVNIVNSERIVEGLIEYTKETKHKGRPLAEDPFVRQGLAQLWIEVNIKRLLGWRTAWLESQGIVPNVEAAVLKIFGHELDQRVAKTGMEILGLYAQLEPGSKWAPLKGIIEHLYRFAIHLSYGGGSHELMRTIIASRGMGLPRLH
ncbi:MAG: acyl-CoA dehydrogenase [Dehalococcoidia bacterium]|nr:MAG: acyl-CoA dehydrogenase [Dehalococcoidia bacterium]